MESRKIISMNLFVRKNGNADIENRLVDTVGEGESGTSGERSIDMHILSWVK